jgi:hypothetical protein
MSDAEQALDSRGVDRDTASVTKHHRVDFDNPMFDSVTSDHYGVISIEYQPRNRVLSEPSVEDYVREVYEATDDPEAFVVALYRGVVSEIFTGYESRERPWEQAPMLISYEYSVISGGAIDEATASTATLGQFM